MNKIISYIDNVQNELDKQRDFLVDSIYNPEKLFDKASDILKSTKRPLFRIMNTYEEGERTTVAHQFQDCLCSILDEFIKTKLNDNYFCVKPRIRNTFPSIFAVYYKDHEIVSFNIFDKLYGIRRKSLQDVEREYKAMEQSFTKEISDEKKELYKYFNARHNTVKFICDHYQERKMNYFIKIRYKYKELFLYTTNPKRYQRALDKAIKKHEDRIEEIESRYAKYNKYSEEVDIIHSLYTPVMLVDRIFKEYNYRLESDKGKLY